MRQFEFARAADEDAANIHQRISEQDASTASLVMERIVETVEGVCVFPQIGKQTKKQGVWVFGGTAKNPFRITYQFDDDKVTVLRIFRASRRDIQF